VFLMRRYDSAEIINVGTGTDVTIAELAAIVARITGYEGRIEYDDSRPDGTPRKLLDVSRITSLGWEPRVALGEGIASVYRWYRESIATSPDPD
jgi:GDP-L-fucose synthase